MTPTQPPRSRRGANVDETSQIGSKSAPIPNDMSSLDELRNSDAKQIRLPYQSHNSSNGIEPLETNECVLFSHQTGGFVRQECESSKTQNNYCFTFWHESNKHMMMGCWKMTGKGRTCPSCEMTNGNSYGKSIFCCCSGDRCNAALNFTEIREIVDRQQRLLATTTSTPFLKASAAIQSAPLAITGAMTGWSIGYMMLSCLPTVFLLVSLLFGYRYYRLRKLRQSLRLSDCKQQGAANGALCPEAHVPFLNKCEIELRQVIAQGRFGTVHRGLVVGGQLEGNDETEGGDGSSPVSQSRSFSEILTVVPPVGKLNGLQTSKFTPSSSFNFTNDRSPIKCGDEVAVKRFAPQEKASWKTEHEVYMLPQMRHKNILRFITAEVRTNNNPLQSYTNEYWLVTEYHRNGSLYDYLKQNTLSFIELLKISLDIAQGLSHLHSHVYQSNCSKPIVAHRDFKSKNVILKADLTACIADFGLALVLYPNQPTAKTLGQVGTGRYMAPEVLDGAIHFSGDALLRIDVYACALVFWEMLSRCSAHGQPACPYLLPFEEELGSGATLEQFQKHVSEAKRRPLFPPGCNRIPKLASFCKTIEDCWDPDAEARISASCVEERLVSLL